MLHYVIYAIALLVACYFQAITGFGQGLVIAPLALILFNKYTALSILMVVGLGLNAYLSFIVTAKSDFKLIRTLVIGCVFGAPLGLVIVKTISLANLQVVVGCLSIMIVLLFVFLKLKISESKTYELVAGFISGLMQTATGLAGPPVVILLNAQSRPKQIMRKTLPIYFLFVGLIGAVIYLFSGVFNSKGIAIGILSLPLVVIAGYFGNHHGRALADKYYRALVVVGVLLTGFLAIFQGLR